MSTEAIPGAFEAASQSTRREFPAPVSHGAGGLFNLDDLEDPDVPAGGRGTLYDRALAFWREHVGEPEAEPYEFEFEAPWLDDERDWVLLLTSSRWKAGAGEGDDYRAYYKYRLKLRERVESAAGVEYAKPPVALSVLLMPQFEGMVYKDGNEYELPYGPGTRLQVESTFVDSFADLETRAHHAVTAAFGDRAMSFDDQIDESRRPMKAEAHHRFHRDKKAAAVETVEQSKQLIDYGGGAELEGRQQRERSGYVEVSLTADRWELLGFEDVDFDIQLKVYQVGDAHQRDDSDWMAHPKIEASFEGVSRGSLPHAEEFDDILHVLRTIVNTHCAWAGITESDLISDPLYDGAGEPTMIYEQPEGRRELLWERYQQVSTEIYREAMKAQTDAVYDILQVVAECNGATYERLVDETGLAYRTVWGHVDRLCDIGIFAKYSENPVLVAYDSQALLDSARQKLDEVKPGDTPEDRQERADEREERRENDERERDEDGQFSEGGADVADPLASQQRGDPTEELGFAHLDDLRCDLSDVVLAYEQDSLGGEDIRVRQDALPLYLR